MRRVMVQYRIKAGKAEENEAFVRAVFEELQANSPDGIRYATFKQEDGVSFVHIASVETDDGSNPLTETPAFKRFQEELRERCDILPQAIQLNEIGSYRVFGD